MFGFFDISTKISIVASGSFVFGISIDLRVIGFWAGRDSLQIH